MLEFFVAPVDDEDSSLLRSDSMYFSITLVIFSPPVPLDRAFFNRTDWDSFKLKHEPK